MLLLTSNSPGREDGSGAIKAMEDALSEAGVNGGQVWSVNAHATSTPLGDRAEAGAISRLTGGSGALVTSNKGSIGHLLGAAGAVEAVFSVMSVMEGVVPFTVNTETLDPGIEEMGLNIVRNKEVGEDKYKSKSLIGLLV